MNSRIASKFAVYPAPSNTVELALHAPPPPRAAPSRSSGPRPSTYLVCLERMPAEPDQARACSRRRSVPGRRRWASPQDLAFVRALDQPEHRHLAVLVEQVFRDPRHAAQQCFKRYFGHRRREERKPVGPIGSWGAGTSENNRLASKQPNRPHLSISTCRPAKLRLLPGPPRSPMRTAVFRSLPNSPQFAGADRAEIAFRALEDQNAEVRRCTTGNATCDENPQPSPQDGISIAAQRLCSVQL